MTRIADEKLAERVRAATGPDRELDSDIGFELGWFPQGRDHYEWIEADGTFVQSVNPKPFTASIDAALALVERCLPGQHVTMGQNLHHHYWLCTFNSLNDEGAPTSIAQEMHKTSLPLAILAALLFALTASEQSND